MFPLEFPLSIIRSSKLENKWVLDPFCGRGTTNFAARVSGLPSVGIDSSPVAVAIAKAKLVDTTPIEVVTLAETLLKAKNPGEVPTGEFWEKCFHPQTLIDLCILRQALLSKSDSDARIALRAIILGALHGPLTKGVPSYFSNQCPRTYAPKPDYSVRFWERKKLSPPLVNAVALITTRANRFLVNRPKFTEGKVFHGDSRSINLLKGGEKFSLIITSPPYYGMRTYIPDQWLRNWFVGGPSSVSYPAAKGEMRHSSAEKFSDQLKEVWENAAKAAHSDARLVIRFGGINGRDANPVEILRQSLKNTDWRITTIRSAGSAKDGQRQAAQFIGEDSPTVLEYDAYARLN